MHETLKVHVGMFKALHTTKVNATPAIQTAPAVIYHKNLKERIYAIN